MGEDDATDLLPAYSVRYTREHVEKVLWALPCTHVVFMPFQRGGELVVVHLGYAGLWHRIMVQVPRIVGRVGNDGSRRITITKTVSDVDVGYFAV